MKYVSISISYGHDTLVTPDMAKSILTFLKFSTKWFSTFCFQFNNFMSVIRQMFDRVEQEHRTKLEQLQKLQDEQK